MEMNENDAESSSRLHLSTTVFTFNSFKSYFYRRSSSRRTSTALRTLTRLDDEPERLLQAENDVERGLGQLIALKNRDSEELEEVYGISVIVTFFLSSTSIYMNFVLLIAHPVFISCLYRINSVLLSLGICLLFTLHIYAIDIRHHTSPHFIIDSFSRRPHHHRLFTASNRIESRTSYNNPTHTHHLHPS